MYNLAIPGWMPESQLKLLEALALRVPPNGTIIEVGSFAGRSSWCFAKTASTAQVYCLDIWNTSEYPYTPPASYDNAVRSDFGNAINSQQTEGTLENFKHFTRDCPNITPIRGRSPVDFTNWSVKADLIFLDGLHHNPGFHADLVFWFDRLKAGGTICGDDCARSHPDVLWTVHDFCKDRDLEFSVKGRIWSITPVYIGGPT